MPNIRMHVRDPFESWSSWVDPDSTRTRFFCLTRTHRAVRATGPVFTRAQFTCISVPLGCVF